jgi:antitoxin CcdA
MLPATARFSDGRERVPSAELTEVRRREWRQGNAEAIAAYNEHVEKHGPFTDDLRSF